MTPTWTILEGDARARLAEMPAGSVHCVVTSPPYWSLREYSVAPLVWGGDPACRHDWDSAGGRNSKPDRSTVGKDLNGSGVFGGGRGDQASKEARGAALVYGYFCSCGAWRGSLGLEPTPELYVEHLVGIFREIRRVLRDDGVAFINMGDSYFGSGRGGYAGGASGLQGSTDGQDLSRVAREVQRALPCDKGGREPRGSSGRDSISSRLCGGCRAALSGDTARSDSPRASARDDGSPAPSQAHTGSEPDHPPTFRSARPTRILRSAGAMQDQPLTEDRDGGQPSASSASTPPRSAPQLPGGCSHCANCGACLAVLRSSSRDARACARRTGAPSWLGSSQPAAPENSGGRGSSADTAAIDDSSAGSTSDRVWTYPYSTMAYRLKPKDLVGMPWRLAFALQADGWWLRSDIVWAKLNPMPESIEDRPTKSHEYVFLLAKSERYFYDAFAIREPTVGSTEHDLTGCGYTAPGQTSQGGNRYRSGNKERVPGAERIAGASHVGRGFPWEDAGLGRNKRDVWTINSEPFPGAHFATFPTALVEPCIRAGTSERGCCPACGAPWQRVVSTTYRNDTTTDGRPAEGNNVKAGADEAKARTMASGVRTRRLDATKGWTQGCECPLADPVPATVLDPFAGAGTTGVVALREGCSFVGIELNPQYAAMARERIGAERPLFSSEVRKVNEAALDTHVETLRRLAE